MLLPGQLRSTTLGDLLGTLHRGAATGALELVEVTGRTHRVHLQAGHVVAVELDRACPSLLLVLREEGVVDEATLKRALLLALSSKRLHGEVLVGHFHLAPSVIDRALRRQLRQRLEALERVAEATVTFRASCRPPRGALVDAPLATPDFLHGRRRARPRAAQPSARPASTPATAASGSPRLRALARLGLGGHATSEEIRARYRALVRTCHPDLHGHVSAAARGALNDELRLLNDAYATLTA